MNSRSDSRIFTLPNVLSFLRLIGVPFFLVLILLGRDLAAVILLAVASFTDFIDGIVARRFNQQGKFGAGGWVLSSAAKIFGWAFAWWGAFMYWWAGLIYVKQTVGLARGVSHD